MTTPDPRPEPLRPPPPLWMVVRDGVMGRATFGPFETREAADVFSQSDAGGYVYDAVQNRKSNCGPWNL